MLLSKATRESLNIDLEDSIVIFDEAHNLVNVIQQMHQVRITSDQVKGHYEHILTLIMLHVRTYR
jgi:chromosome transmission fidelity protein 1